MKKKMIMLAILLNIGSINLVAMNQENSLTDDSIESLVMRTALTCGISFTVSPLLVTLGGVYRLRNFTNINSGKTGLMVAMSNSNNQFTLAETFTFLGRRISLTYVDKVCPNLYQFFLMFTSLKNAIDNNGKTALIYGTEANETDKVRYLLDYNVDPHIADNTSKRGLEYAAENRNKDLIRLFLSRDVQCKTKEEMTQIGLSEEAQKLLLDESCKYLVKQSVPYARILEAKKMAEPQIFSILSGVYGKGIVRPDVKQKIKEKLLTPEILQAREQAMDAAMSKVKIRRAKVAEDEIGGLC